MQSVEALPLLNHLLNLLARSLPIYLADARPYTHTEKSEFLEALRRLASDQRKYADRVAEEISRLGGRPNPGRFPVEFTGKNDLALDFLFWDVIENQEQNVFLLEYFADQLIYYPRLHSLAREILDHAKQHLETLHRSIRDAPQPT